MNTMSWFRDKDTLRETEQFQEKLQKVEQHFKRMADLLTKHASKVEKLSHRAGKFPKAVNKCVRELEEPSTAQHFINFSDCLLTLQSYRQKLADDLRSRTTTGLLFYKKKCREMRKEIKDYETQLKTEKTEFANFERSKTKHSTDREMMLAAKVKHEKAMTVSARSKDALLEQMQQLETDKLQGLQRTLFGIASDEMQFHAHALQMYTKAYQLLAKLPSAHDQRSVPLPIEKRDACNHGNEESWTDAQSERRDSGPLSLSDL